MNILQRKGKTEQEASNLISKEENLPIWSPVRLGRSELIADAIAANKSNLTAVEPGIDDNALHWAIRQNQVDILTRLLKTAKMDPNVTNRHLRTPMYLSALCGYCDATSVLLNHGAKLEATDKCGATPLSIAYSNKNFPVQSFRSRQGLASTRGISTSRRWFSRPSSSRVRRRRSSWSPRARISWPRMRTGDGRCSSPRRQRMIR